MRRRCSRPACSTRPPSAAAAGKQFNPTPDTMLSRIYVLDRDNLGQFDSQGDHVLQEIDNQIQGSFGTAAYFNGKIYYHGTGAEADALKAFDVSDGVLSS